MEYRYSNKWFFWGIGGVLLLMALANKNWLYAVVGVIFIALGFKRKGEDYL